MAIKSLLVLGTLYLSAPWALFMFALFCLTQQSSRENIILAGTHKKEWTDARKIDYLIKNTTASADPTPHFTNLMASVAAFTGQKKFIDPENDFKTEASFYEAVAKNQVFLIEIASLYRRTKVWQGYKFTRADLTQVLKDIQIPSKNGRDTARLRPQSSAKSERDPYLINQHNAAIVLVLMQLYPEHEQLIYDSITYDLFDKISKDHLPENATYYWRTKYSSRLKESLNALSGSSLGVPYELYFRYKYDPKKRYHYLLQLGSQFAFSITLPQHKKKIALCAILNITALFLARMFLPPLIPLLLAILLIAIIHTIRKDPLAELRLSIGYHPYSAKSRLFRSRENNKVIYALGVILWNVLMNVCVISAAGYLVGGNIIFHLMGLRTLLIALSISIIDKFSFLADNLTTYRQSNRTINDLVASKRTMKRYPIARFAGANTITLCSKAISTIHSATSNLIL